MRKNMFYTTILVVILVFIGGCVINQEWKEPTDNQKFCNVDDDCATVPGDGCSCGEPINKIFKEKYMKDHRIAWKNYEGGVCDILCVPSQLKCVNNTCIKEFIKDQKRVNCEDEEGSIDYYTKGKITTWINGFNESYEDYCLPKSDYPSGNVLYERYCEGFFQKDEKYTCPNGCEDGACIR